MLIDFMYITSVFLSLPYTDMDLQWHLIFGKPSWIAYSLKAFVYYNNPDLFI